MDKKEKVLQFSNYRRILNNQIDQLRLKKDQDLEIFYNGGAFSVTRDLICFVQLLVERDLERAVLLDSNDRPIEVVPVDFLEELFDCYFRATNSYFNEYQRVASARDVESILDLDD